MSGIMKAMYNIRLLDELAVKRTAVHGINPLAKLLTTFAYIVIVVSFGKYELSGLLPLALYPFVIIPLAELPVAAILKRLLAVAPFALVMGIFNPLLDTRPYIVLPWVQVSGGWVSFSSIVLKFCLTVSAALMLLATTGIARVASALRALGVPRVFAVQLLLTYRYISVLLEEVARLLCAYSLRSPETKGIHYKHWGPLTGQLLMRTIDRAQRVYRSMCCRGYTGEYDIERIVGMKMRDFFYTACWIMYFVAARLIDIPALLGSAASGVLK